MRFEGSYLIPANREKVWHGLNDPAILAQAIPGCQAMERTGQCEFTATVVAKAGPVSATFKGKVELADLNPPVSYTLRGRGQGGPAGFAKGEARISLAEEGDGTRLTYIADADIGGKLASVGGRLIQGVAKKTADDFFAAFSDVLTGAKRAATDEAEVKSAAMAAVQASALAEHIPLIDRIAWFLVGLAVGVGINFVIG
ncbi:MAG: carbon monoxide dehydrogenase subunit G [Rhodobacteraceae bacterium]|nr:carbon monoxide dehydrogenase subunit G [Paracoccaceae bacterium]